MHIDEALAELRSFERRKGGKIDDESVPFLAHLRNGGLLNDDEWLALQACMADAIDFLRQSALDQGGPIDVDGDPRNADWNRLVRTFRLTNYKLPGWATLWLRRLHLDTDTAFWSKVAHHAAELGLASMTKSASEMETKMFDEEDKTTWFSVSDPPSRPGMYELRTTGSHDVSYGQYADDGWNVPFDGPTEWRGLISNPHTLPLANDESSSKSSDDETGSGESWLGWQNVNDAVEALLAATETASGTLEDLDAADEIVEWLDGDLTMQIEEYQEQLEECKDDSDAAVEFVEELKDEADLFLPMLEELEDIEGQLEDDLDEEISDKARNKIIESVSTALDPVREAMLHLYYVFIQAD